MHQERLIGACAQHTKELITQFVLCCAFLCFDISWFSHVLHHHFTGTGSIIWPEKCGMKLFIPFPNFNSPGLSVSISQMLSLMKSLACMHICRLFSLRRYQLIQFDVVITLQWRYSERDGISNHRRLDYLLNHLFRRRSKETSKLRVTGIYERNSPVTGEFPAQRANNAENVTFYTHTQTYFELTRYTLCLTYPLGRNMMWLWLISWWKLFVIYKGITLYIDCCTHR